ncbi:hypothetical protein SISNIDRAFT_458584, partial [Sistotremastrum niveocremeum HHB9708]
MPPNCKESKKEENNEEKPELITGQPIARSNPKLEPSRGQPIRDQQAMPNDRPDDTPRPTRGARMCHGSDHEARL